MEAGGFLFTFESVIRGKYAPKFKVRFKQK